MAYSSRQKSFLMNDLSSVDQLYGPWTAITGATTEGSLEKFITDNGGELSYIPNGTLIAVKDANNKITHYVRSAGVWEEKDKDQLAAAGLEVPALKSIGITSKGNIKINESKGRYNYQNISGAKITGVPIVGGTKDVKSGNYIVWEDIVGADGTVNASFTTYFETTNVDKWQKCYRSINMEVIENAAIKMQTGTSGEIELDTPTIKTQVGAKITDGTNESTIANLISGANRVPAPTADQNGKVLTVNNGTPVWQTATGGSGSGSGQGPYFAEDFMINGIATTDTTTLAAGITGAVVRTDGTDKIIELPAGGTYTLTGTLAGSVVVGETNGVVNNIGISTKIILNNVHITSSNIYSGTTIPVGTKFVKSLTQGATIITSTATGTSSGVLDASLVSSYYLLQTNKGAADGSTVLAAGTAYSTDGKTVNIVPTGSSQAITANATYYTFYEGKVPFKQTYGIKYACDSKKLTVQLAANSYNVIECTASPVGTDCTNYKGASIYSDNNIAIVGEGYLALRNDAGHGIKASDLYFQGHPHIYAKAFHDAFHGESSIIINNGYYYIANANDGFGTRAQVSIPGDTAYKAPGYILIYDGIFEAHNIKQVVFDSKGQGYFYGKLNITVDTTTDTNAELMSGINRFSPEQYFGKSYKRYEKNGVDDEVATGHVYVGDYNGLGGTSPEEVIPDEFGRYIINTTSVMVTGYIEGQIIIGDNAAIQNGGCTVELVDAYIDSPHGPAIVYESSAKNVCIKVSKYDPTDTGNNSKKGIYVVPVNDDVVATGMAGCTVSGASGSKTMTIIPVNNHNYIGIIHADGYDYYITESVDYSSRTVTTANQQFDQGIYSFDGFTIINLADICGKTMPQSVDSRSLLPSGAKYYDNGDTEILTSDTSGKEISYIVFPASTPYFNSVINNLYTTGVPSDCIVSNNNVYVEVKENGMLMVRAEKGNGLKGDCVGFRQSEGNIILDGCGKSGVNAKEVFFGENNKVFKGELSACDCGVSGIRSKFNSYGASGAEGYIKEGATKNSYKGYISFGLKDGGNTSADYCSGIIVVDGLDAAGKITTGASAVVYANSINNGTYIGGKITKTPYNYLGLDEYPTF